MGVHLSLCDATLAPNLLADFLFKFNTGVLLRKLLCKFFFQACTVHVKPYMYFSIKKKGTLLERHSNLCTWEG